MDINNLLNGLFTSEDNWVVLKTEKTYTFVHFSNAEDYSNNEEWEQVRYSALLHLLQR